MYNKRFCGFKLENVLIVIAMELLVNGWQMNGVSVLGHLCEHETFIQCP